MTEAHDDAELIKTLRMNELFDFYGDLLTAKQRRYIELYYADDLSLGEIAEEFSVSRQAVYDNIRRTGKHEIGRGTSTYDGLSLAWACAENLANKIKALTLFATHYFELTQLPEKMEGVANVHLDALEHGDTIAFMHSVQDGAASKSYGLAVATQFDFHQNSNKQQYRRQHNNCA